jgi:hypothetical protein
LIQSPEKASTVWEQRWDEFQQEAGCNKQSTNLSTRPLIVEVSAASEHYRIQTILLEEDERGAYSN